MLSIKTVIVKRGGGCRYLQLIRSVKNQTGDARTEFSKEVINPPQKFPWSRGRGRHVDPDHGNDTRGWRPEGG